VSAVPHTAGEARRFPGPAVAAVLVLAAVLMTAATQLPSPLRAIVSLPIALLAPGAALLVLLRGRFGADDELDVGTDAALCVVLSFVAWVLIALGLYAAGQRLRTPAVVAAGDALIVLGAVGAAVRGRRRQPLRAWQDGVVTPILLAATVGAAALAVVVAIHVVPANPGSPYSSIALGGAWANIDTAVYAKPARRVDVEIQVANHTHRRRSYVVNAVMKKSSWTGDQVTLSPGQTWTGVVSGHVPKGGCLHNLAISLSEKGAAKPIGTLTLYLQSRRPLPRGCTQ
jgi:uncharacterized membrane protein